MTETPDPETVQKAIDELIAARPKLAIAHHNRLRIIVTAARAWLDTTTDNQTDLPTKDLFPDTDQTP